MSILIYRGLQMKIVHSRFIGRDAVMSRDRTDFLYWRWTFDCDCVFNPAATAFSRPSALRQTVSATVNGQTVTIPVAPAAVFIPPGPAGPVPATGPVNPAGAPLPSFGAAPVITDAALKDYLGRPHGQLIYAVESLDGSPPTALLVSPLPGYRTDTAGAGPAVEVNGITQIIGSRTFLINLRITACVNQSSVTSVGGLAVGYPVLLSHRFRQTCDTGEDFLADWITEGEAVFRADELLKRGLSPDDYRGYLLPPLDPGMRRVEETVVATEDRRALQYRVLDRELPMIVSPVSAGAAVPFGSNLVGVGNVATKVEAYEKRHMSDPSPASALLTSAATLVGAGISADPGPNRDLRGRGVAPRAVRVAAGVGRAALTIAYTTFPVLTMSVRVRVWGHKKATRKSLENIAYGIAVARIRSPRTGVSTVASVEQEITGKFIEMEMAHVFAWVPGRFQSTVDAFAGAPTPTPFAFIFTMPRADDTIPWLLDPGRVLPDTGAVSANAQTMPLPNSGGTRGWYNRKLTTPVPVALNSTLQTDVPQGGFSPSPPTDSTPP